MLIQLAISQLLIPFYLHHHHHNEYQIYRQDQRLCSKLQSYWLPYRDWKPKWSLCLITSYIKYVIVKVGTDVVQNKNKSCNITMEYMSKELDLNTTHLTIARINKRMNTTTKTLNNLYKHLELLNTILYHTSCTNEHVNT